MTNGQTMFRAGASTSGSGADTTKRVSFYDQSGSIGGGIITGSGTPEGSVHAIVGTLYLRTNGGAGSTLYVKDYSQVRYRYWTFGQKNSILRLGKNCGEDDAVCFKNP